MLSPLPHDELLDHPLWETQVELEQGMLRRGAKAVAERVKKATERDQLTRLDPVRGLLQEWLPVVVKGLQIWLQAMRCQPGPKPISVGPLSQCDQYVVSAIALRTMLDSLTTDRRALTGIAGEIGRMVEHEEQVREWEAQEPALFHAQRKKFERDHATDTHRRRVNINQFNALMRDGKFGFGWTPWGDEMHFRVGATLVDIIIRHTHWFALAPDPTFVWRKGAKARPAIVIVPREGLLQWLGDQLEHQELTSPAYQPTVIPPRRWDGTRSGGYHTKFIKPPRLIAFKASQRQQQEGAADEYDAIDMPEVYSAVHMLQEVPWRINKQVYAVAACIDDLELGLAGIPVEAGRPLPPKLPEDATEAQVTLWKREAAQVYKHNAEHFAHRMRATRSLELAEQYLPFDAIYFPHKLDFRGRIYPIPVGLQPQGDDLARGLLEFSEGKPVGSNGWRWLAIQLATMWGSGWDKKPFDERIELVKQNETMWRRIAGSPKRKPKVSNLSPVAQIGSPNVGPLKSREWCTADKPWAALSAIYDWVGYLDNGEEWVSHAHISVDGTCNGIQHLSAMVRDEIAGYHVNLVPTERPQDIYKFVAQELQPTLERIEKAGGGEQAEHATYWLDLCVRELPRSLTKRPVMVLPYGATKEAFFKYIREWLDSADPAKPTDDYSLRNQRIAFLKGHMWDAVGHVVKRGLEVMDWLKECAQCASKGNQPIFWRTPSGFVVRHFYGRLRLRQVDLYLDGSRFQVGLPQVTSDLDIKHQILGIAPNFVHSMDASTLVLCVNRCAKDGITAFAAVHDDYGTHAADMDKLQVHLREAFITTHEVDVLAGFRNACHAVMVAEIVDRTGCDPLEAAQIADEKLPQPLARGNLDLQGVRDSAYFFA